MADSKVRQAFANCRSPSSSSGGCDRIAQYREPGDTASASCRSEGSTQGTISVAAGDSSVVPLIHCPVFRNHWFQFTSAPHSSSATMALHFTPHLLELQSCHFRAQQLVIDWDRPIGNRRTFWKRTSLHYRGLTHFSAQIPSCQSRGFPFARAAFVVRIQAPAKHRSIGSLRISAARASRSFLLPLLTVFRKVTASLERADYGCRFADFAFEPLDLGHEKRLDLSNDLAQLPAVRATVLRRRWTR